MPIRGVIFIAVVALMIAAIRKDRIYSWIEILFGEDADNEEKEN